MNKTLKTIIIAALILGAMAAAYALGSSGRLTMVEQADRLMGMLITAQPLTEGGDGKVYAERVDREYVFNGVEGMQCFFTVGDDTDNAVVTHIDAAFTDKYCDVHAINDDGQSVAMKAKLYLGTSFKDMLFYNPVYQTASGELYAVGGQGNQFEGEPGMSSSLPLSESVKRYENGKMLTYGTSVNIEAEVISEPEKIIVSQFDAAGKLLSSESFTPGALPDSMESTAAYIVVGTVSQIGTQYEVFQPDDGSISALYCREDNVCVMQSCIVGWEGE